MTLFSVAKKNIQGNFRSYLIYFLSMLVSIVIFFTFVSLQYSGEMQQIIESSYPVDSIFTQASIILILFVFIFIWYSNSFFIRRRKREIALYSLLGLRKRTIGRMMFYENMIMGALVLLAGIVLGTFLSKLFAMLLVRLVGSSVEVGLSLSWEAVGRTALVFAVMILLTSVQGYRLIYRFSLIELFQASGKGERPPKLSVPVAVLAVILLAATYWLMVQPITSNAQYMRNMSLVVVGAVSGTYLLFRFVTVALIRLAQRRKSGYYRGMNMIAASHMLHRVQGNARTFTILALLSAVTISSFTTVYSQYYTSERLAEKSMPLSYIHLSKGEAFDGQVRSLLEADTAHPIAAELDIPIVRMSGDLSEIDVRVSDLPRYEAAIRIISAETYNRISAALDRQDTVRLSGHEAAVIRPLYTDHSAGQYVNHAIGLDLPGGAERFMLVDMMIERMFDWSFPDVFFIVSDAKFADIAGRMETQTFKGYVVEGQKYTKSTSDRLHAMDADGVVMTFYTAYKEEVESRGIDIFLIGFLGLVFLAATGSMIYFKQLTETETDKGRYDILRKIGVSKREIGVSVAKQTAYVFGLPLLVGLLHSAFILKTTSKLYSSLIDENILIPVLTSMTVYIMIYIGYYGLTVVSMRKLLR